MASEDEKQEIRNQLWDTETESTLFQGLLAELHKNSKISIATLLLQIAEKTETDATSFKPQDVVFLNEVMKVLGEDVSIDEVAEYFGGWD